MRKFRRITYNADFPQYIKGNIYLLPKELKDGCLIDNVIKYHPEFWEEVFDKPKLFKLL